jgi:predicted DNA-binding transcriptional regulator YafY
VTTTSSRLLRLLALLGSRPSWTNAQLAERMEVTERTIRRDVARLRALGYGIVSEGGPYGGYRLSAGNRLAPLSLDDEEALAVTVALREAASSGVLGDDRAAMSALLKLRQILPPHIAVRLGDLDGSFVHTARFEAGHVDSSLLLELATACRRGDRLSLSYRDMRGRDTLREVDPHRLVRSAHRWYLVALDVERGEWRTFRADRIRAARPTGARTELVDPPDAAAMVSRMLLSDYPVYAVIRVALPLAQARRLVPPHRGSHRADGPDTTFITVGGASPEDLARDLLRLGTPMEVDAPDEVLEAMRAHARAVLAALEPSAPVATDGSASRCRPSSASRCSP